MQFNKTLDDRMERLEQQLAEAVREKEKAESRYNLLFEQVFDTFDQAVGIGVPAQYVCQDGFKLARIVPQMQPVVNNDKAREVVLAFGPADMGLRMWNRITDVVRVVNQDKLAKEIRKYPALGEALDAADAITVPQRKPSRVRREATKQERMLLEHTAQQDVEEVVS